MSIFKEVTLTWKGETFTIAPDHVLRAIAIVEERVTLHELMKFQQRGTAPLSTLSSAFASVLRYAGAKVTDEEVYAAMFSGDQAISVGQAISALLLMMVPPGVGESAEGNVSKGEAPSSKKRMKPSSAAPPA